MAASVETRDSNLFYRTIKVQRAVSTAAKIFGTKHVKVLQESEIWHDVVIRGDLADVVIGADTTIGAASVIRPPFNGTKEAPGYLSVSIGSHSAVGAGVVCEAAEIGSNVVVGDGAVLGPRSRVCDGARVRAGAVIPSDFVVPPFSEASGAPATLTHGGIIGSV